MVSPVNASQGRGETYLFALFEKRRHHVPDILLRKQWLTDLSHEPMTRTLHVYQSGL